MAAHTEYSDGREHRIACPSPKHPGDRSGKNAVVQLMPDGGWMLKCWSGGCSYASIAEGLGIELPRRSRGRASLDRFLIAVYDHPDGVPRKVYRKDWPKDFPEAPAHCPFKSKGEVCGSTENPHKHIWGPGSPKGTHLKLWGPDASDNWLLVVEGEKTGAAGMRADLNDKGYTPTSWRGGESAAKSANWSRAAERRCLFWPDKNEVGIEAMHDAARQAKAAGATALEIVDMEMVAGLNVPEGGDLADLAGDEIMAVLATAAPYESPDEPPDEDEPPPAKVKFDSLDEYLIPSANHATDAMIAVRFLRDHGDDMVGATYPTPAKDEQPSSDLYTVRSSGLLVRSDGLIGKRLAQSKTRYLADLDMADLGNSEYKIVYTYARSLRAQSATKKVRVMLDSAYQEIEALGFTGALAGYRHVEADDVNADLNVLGAPNGVIDLTTGELLTGKAAAERLTSWSIPDPYDPKAEHEDVVTLLKHLDGDQREWLLSAFGYHLKGEPDRRLYLLRGDPGGGKGTMLDAVRCALGTPYGSVVPAGGLKVSKQGGSGPTPELLQFVGPRIMIDNELREGQIDTALLNMLAGGDPQMARGLHKDFDKPIEPTATLFISVNMNANLYLTLQDSALYERVRILPYPGIPEGKRDRGLRRRVKRDPKVRQAMVALLVSYAVETVEPPDDIPSVGQARRDARDEAIGEAGQWILDNIVATGNDVDRLSIAAIWGAARSASASTDGDKALGRSKDSFLKLLRDMLGLPVSKGIWLPDEAKTARGWQGVRFAKPDERQQRQTAMFCEAMIDAADPDAKCAQPLNDDGSCPVDDAHVARG